MKGSTIKQIAKELGISASTVSRALNDKKVVKEETRQRVLEMAKRYAYTPNEVARSLKNSATLTIAVVLPDISETFFGKIVNQIDRVVAKAGYMLLIADTHEKIEKEQKILNMLYKRRVDALVLATVDCHGETVKDFLEYDIPVVFVDNIPSLQDVDSITIDNRRASRLAVEYLASNGHKRIATVIGSENETTGLERLHGYRRALAECGLEIDEKLIAYGDYKEESGYACMEQLLVKRNEVPFTAVYVTSEKMTHGVMNAIYDKGLRVPEDISVIGFDMHAFINSSLQKVTSVRQPEEEIGQRVGKLLLERLRQNTEESVNKQSVFLQPYLEEGNTVKSI